MEAQKLAEDVSGLWQLLLRRRDEWRLSDEAYEGYRRILRRVCLNNKGRITIGDPELARA